MIENAFDKEKVFFLRDYYLQLKPIIRKYFRDLISKEFFKVLFDKQNYLILSYRSFLSFLSY